MSQYFSRARLTFRPSQNRTGAVNASGSQLTPLTSVEQPNYLTFQRCIINGLSSFGNQVHDPLRIRQRVVQQVVVVALPTDSRVLTSPPHPAQPQAACCFSVFHHPTPIVIDVVVLKMSLQLRTQSRPDFPRRLGQIPSEPFFQSLKLYPQLLL